MTISVTGISSNRSRPVAAGRQAAGFTLLELMVVLVLVGIIFSFAVLSMGGDDVGELMERETRRLETLLALAAEEAIIRGEEVGVHFTDNGYEFLLLSSSGWQPPAQDDMLRPHVLPEGIEMTMELDGDPPALSGTDEEDDDDDGESVTPQVYILSSGEMTPFSVRFASPFSEVRYHLVATGLGELSREREERL